MRLPSTTVFIQFYFQCLYTGIYILIGWRVRKLLVDGVQARPGIVDFVGLLIFRS